MFAEARTKFVRISPRKARRAADLVRGLGAMEAMMQLAYDTTKGAKLLRKTLKSAVCNAEIKLDLSRERLAIKEVRVDEGPTLKRAKPRCRGGRTPIMKRMSHFTVVLAEKQKEEQ